MILLFEACLIFPLQMLLTFSQTTNSRHFQTEGVADENIIFEKMVEILPNGFETLWKKEKVLVMSDF